MLPNRMHLEVLLPYRIFMRKMDVSRIVAETAEGSFGLLPNRLDCVASLTPGILIFETTADGEVFIAVDQGVLVKTGLDVRVSVRRAMAGADLARLRDTVQSEFLAQDEQARSLRAVMTKLETGFLARFARLRHD
ncbi:F0F1 ATP synthase subunit epsilon [Cupriavidus sp. D39]|uniref:F0F1 ATP synthase subunit epsilon n=1 Tax=Cupriavidus sp. D39 TaxID=2997877 RepID=UPI00226EDD9F|nr:F0F1 ATP synthase subunit epsilon [Cupriavidus sp. D39]MCY0854766.1 F0F1 ATP synthase subunit epsilon [Cupriavidus sp. D39]